MTILLPKPVKPEPAPRRPLQRNTKPIARKSPLRSSKPRKSCRPRRIRQRSNSETAKLRRDAWDLLRRIVRARAGHRCERCGYVSSLPYAEWLDPAHVLAKGSWKGMALDVSNVRALCRRCHEELGSAQPDMTKPCPFRAWFIPKFGLAEWLGLLDRARKPGPDVRDVLPALRKTADELGIK